MMLFESLIFNLLPAAVGIMVLVLVFESCWRKCPPDKLMIVSGAGKMRSVSGKGTFVIPLLQRVDTLSLGAVQVQLTTENDIPTQDAIRQNQLDLKQADLKKQADKAKAEADMVKATVTAEKQRELYIAQQEAEIAAETKKVELAERQADVRERELNATVKKQAEADRYAAEQAAEADLYKRTKQAEAARIERQNQSDAELYSAQKDAEGIQARAKAEAEATRLKGESEGAAEKAHGEGVAAGIKAQAEAYNGMDNPYLLANRYIDIMPKVAEQVAKPLTAVDSIKMYGSGNAQKLVKETTSIVDQVASGLKDSTGIDLPSLLNGLISNPDIDVDSAENSVE